MSSDEIAKLHQLFKEGALTEQEYEAQKQALLGSQPKAKKRWPWWVKLPIALIAIGVGINGLMGITESDPKEVPKCSETGARDLMKSAIENNAASNANTLKLLDLIDTREVSYSAETKERVCQGVAFLNSGKARVRYRMWISANKRLLIEVNEL